MPDTKDSMVSKTLFLSIRSLQSSRGQYNAVIKGKRVTREHSGKRSEVFSEIVAFPLPSDHHVDLSSCEIGRAHV